MIVSEFAFVWIVSLLTSVVAGVWVIVDAVRLQRALKQRPPDMSDRIFGSIIGMAVGIIGVLGVLEYHLGG